MSARTGSTIVAVLRPAALAARRVGDDEVSGANAGASETAMDFEFGLTELTTIELNTEDGVTLTLQADSNQLLHPGCDAEASVPLQAAAKHPAGSNVSRP